MKMYKLTIEQVKFLKDTIPYTLWREFNDNAELTNIVANQLYNDDDKKMLNWLRNTYILNYYKK